MSRRWIFVLVALLLLGVPTIIHAQEVQPEPVLTEAQINEGFRISSTATRRISNLAVEVLEDGVQVSFDLTITRNGTTNTLNIIAILIGLFNQPQISTLELENAAISSYSAPTRLQQEVSNLVLRSWNNYAAGVIAQLPTDGAAAQGLIMKDMGCAVIHCP